MSTTDSGHEQPLVSIITPSFNRSYIIDDTAGSIFSQEYGDWEWIIVDDGSTDDSWSKLQSFAAEDRRVKVFKREADPKGAAHCRNIGVRHSNGKYLVFLDTDDLLAPFCVSGRVEVMEQNPELDFAIFPMLLFKKTPFDLGLLWNVDNEKDDIERLLFHDPVCQGTGTLWKKQSFIGIGMWDVSLMLWQDIELHLRSLMAGLKYRKYLDRIPDVYLRISDNSLSRGGFHSAQKLKSRMKIFEQTAQGLVKRNPNRYTGGLRFMGFDILLSAVRSGAFSEAAVMLERLSAFHLLRANEHRLIRTYIRFRKMKLYKIPLADSRFMKLIRSGLTKEVSSLGKVSYEHNT